MPLILLLLREILLYDFVSISLVFYCPDQILEAANVNFVVKYALEVFKVNLFSQNAFKFGLVSFAMQRLSNCRLIRFICQLCVDVIEFCIDFLLEAGVITLGGRSSTHLSQALYLMEDVFSALL